MPDISMCNNCTCPKKNRCSRFNANASYWQTYGNFRPDKNGKCDYFIKSKSKFKKPDKVQGDSEGCSYE